MTTTHTTSRRIRSALAGFLSDLRGASTSSAVGFTSPQLRGYPIDRDLLESRDIPRRWFV